MKVVQGEAGCVWRGMWRYRVEEVTHNPPSGPPAEDRSGMINIKGLCRVSHQDLAPCQFHV